MEEIKKVLKTSFKERLDVNDSIWNQIEHKIDSLIATGQIAVKIKLNEEIGKMMLEKNIHNRKVSDATRKTYNRFFRENEWVYNNATLAFSNERLLDGQHRLNGYNDACYENGSENINYETLVVVGLDDSTFTSIDSGKGRSIADDNTIEGFEHAAIFKETIHKVFLYMNDSWGGRGPHTITKIDAENIRQAYPALYDSVIFVKEAMQDGNMKGFTKPDILAFFHFLSTNTPHQEKVEKFIEQFLDNNYRGNNCPIFESRYAWQISKSNQDKQNKSYAIVKLLTYALNMYVNDMTANSTTFSDIGNVEKQDDFDLNMLIPLKGYGQLPK
jgi:hypothetical protein